MLFNINKLLNITHEADMSINNFVDSFIISKNKSYFCKLMLFFVFSTPNTFFKKKIVFYC